MLRVGDLGMELKAVEASPFIHHHGGDAALRFGKQIECIRESSDVISMTHPNFEGIRKPFRERRRRASHPDSHASVLARRSRFDETAEAARHELHPVTDPKNGDAERKNAVIYVRSVRIRYALRPAGNNHSDRTARPDTRRIRIPRQNFAVNAKFANASRYQLGKLRTTVENYYVFHGISSVFVRSQP